MTTNRTWPTSHNVVAELDPKVLPDVFTDMANFLNVTSLKYALTENPTIYKSHVKQFWATAEEKTRKGVKYIRAMVDDQKIVVSEHNIRVVLQLDDEDGTTGLTKEELNAGLEALGYVRQGNGTKIQKGSFSPKWKFLAHTLLHCFSPKTTGWNEVNASMASAMICLSKGDPFNFSKLIFDGFVSNLKGKYFIYPRFIQMLVNDDLEHTVTHRTIFECKKLGSVSFTFLAKENTDFPIPDVPLTPYMLELIDNAQGEESGTQTDSQHTPTSDSQNDSENVLPSSPTQKTYTRRPASKSTELPQTSVRMENVADGAITGDAGDKLVRADTTASSLAAEQDSVNILKTQSKATSPVDDSLELDTRDGIPSQLEHTGYSDDHPRGGAEFMSIDSPLGPGNTGRSEEDRHETNELMAPPHVQTDIVNDPPLGPGNTGRSGETRLKTIEELMATCTNLETKCTNLESKVTVLETLTADQGALIKTMQQQMTQMQAKLSSLNSAAMEEDASKQGRKSSVSGEEDGGIKFVAATDVIEGDENVFISAADVVDTTAEQSTAIGVDSIVDTTAMVESTADVSKVGAQAEMMIVDDSLASGEEKGDDSGDNVEKFVVVDKNNQEAVLDEAIQVKDSAAQESTAEISAAGSGSGDNSVAETLLMLQEKISIEQTSQPLPVVPVTIPQSQPSAVSQPIHVSLLPKKGVTIREPTPIAPKAKAVLSSSDKGKSKVLEEEETDSSDDENVLKKIPQEFWPKDKLEDADKQFALQLAMGDAEGIDVQQRILQEHEVFEALKDRRTSEVISDTGRYTPTPAEVDYLIRKNPEVHKKALELTADVNLSEVQRTEQLHEFIGNMIIEADKNIQASYQGKQKKRKRNQTPAQVVKQMKNYLVAQCSWKMAEFKGMQHDEVMLHYYSGYKMNSDFIPMGSEAEAQWIKKNSEFMAACREKAKKTKMEGSGSAAVTEQATADMFLLEHSDEMIEPVQVKQPIVDWDVTDDEFLKSWKIFRAGGELDVYRDFEDLVRSCDREDIHALWSLVKSKNLHADPENVKAMELWVCLQRMYNPDVSDRHWKLVADSKNLIWKHYKSSNVHHVSTQDGDDVFMFVEKDYPLKAGVLEAMMEAKLRCAEVTPDLQGLVERFKQQSTRETGRR